MGTFATLTDMASEIKAAAIAEVDTPGAGAALVTFTDASAVTTAVAAAVVEVEAYVVEVAVAAAAEEAAEITPVVEVPVVVAPVVAAAPVIIVDTASSFAITGATGASWTSSTTGTQSLETTYSGGVLDVTTDVNASATEFSAAFGDASVDMSGLGSLAITNVTKPAYGSKDNAEVTVVISETGSTGKITVGFTLDWSVSGNNVTVSSDDTTVDITYVERDNSSTTVNIANGSDLTNSVTIASDNTYGGGGSNTTTLNINALALIADLNATGSYTFSDLETRFASAGTELDVSVDVTNIGVYFGTTPVTSITSTIDIV
jgi:hypothetical protein